MTCYDLHAAAMAQNQNFYHDPQTGFRVFTERGHKQRGTCCGCACRHCPFGHERVPQNKRAAKARVPVLLHPESLGHPECDVLFWSGGKDSFLTLLYLQKELRDIPRDIVLLTTFDGSTRVVAHQEIPFETIVHQSQHLGCSLLAVPLYAGVDYLERIGTGLDQLAEHITVKRLVFGDLHLEHIRAWREESFASLPQAQDLELHFPLWGRSYQELLEAFGKSGAIATLSAVPEPRLDETLQTGMRFTPEFVSQLPPGLDPFGENGEFHTCVSWPEAP